MWYSIITVQQTDDDAIVAQVTTDQQSPWFSGHFPGDPILPGIAQLKMVTDVIGKALEKDLHLIGLTRIKFKKLIRPGVVLDIHAISGKQENNYSFRITSNQENVCSGTLTLAPKQEN
ncbi:MAG: hypothetical protein KKD01_07165 [Proteobacteria bacterium]|nr:hypothetical protein [Pseudomonadota bacterium]MBU1234474.1 hypothetical protein [Pseudomonadota bacterium]MBU1418425.1 hypothetical protein [Pseudomonadota bacterium]MBU1454494.1 hypothetical protein [Pseudomonadota bacterium]